MLWKQSWTPWSSIHQCQRHGSSRLTTSVQSSWNKLTLEEVLKFSNGSVLLVSNAIARILLRFSRTARELMKTRHMIRRGTRTQLGGLCAAYWSVSWSMTSSVRCPTHSSWWRAKRSTTIEWGLCRRTSSTSKATKSFRETFSWTIHSTIYLISKSNWAPWITKSTSSSNSLSLSTITAIKRTTWKHRSTWCLCWAIFWPVICLRRHTSTGSWPRKLYQIQLATSLRPSSSMCAR